MHKKSHTPEHSKLTIIYSVEQGCLGPKGADLIQDFCTFLSKKLYENGVEFCHWKVQRRINIHQRETQYEINGKSIDLKKADKYLHLFNISIDNFEDDLDDKVVHFIEVYLNRHP